MTNAITWAVLKEWSEVMGEQLTQWQARLFIKMDHVFRDAAEKFKPSKKKD